MALCNFNPNLWGFPLQGLSVSSFDFLHQLLLSTFSSWETRIKHFSFLRTSFRSLNTFRMCLLSYFRCCILPIAEIPGIWMLFIARVSNLFEGQKVWFLHQGKETQPGKVDGSYGATVKRKEIKKVRKPEHHLWKKNDSAGSGQKALNLVRIISGLPNEKEAVYGALNKWVAWEVEFPIIAAAKALQILRKRSQWHRVIQVAKWMLSKGQGATMGTYDTLLLAFDMDERPDEAESLWNMILHTHTRSIPRRLFARMIALYAHHDLQDKVIEVFADMEELKVRPDEDTAKRVARAFRELGQEEKRKLVLRRYLSEFKYIYFNGERVKVKRYSSEEG